MRYELSQLQAMSDETLYQVWADGAFPFEMADCGRCLTAHSASRCHVAIGSAVRDLNGGWELHAFHPTHNRSFVDFLRAKLPELFALRLFYDHLYVPEQQESAVEQGELIEAT